jgi:cell wall-associated NlpC family hydrolase
MARNTPSARHRRSRHHTGSAGVLLVVAVLILASCTSAPRYRSGPPDSGSREADRQEIVRFARSFVGTPYRSGGTSRNGVDCSGLIVAVYREFDIRLPRTSLDQSRAGDRVNRSKIRPADLVFFKTSRSRPVSHVGIYIGDGKFIHASTSAHKVRIDRLDDDYFRHRFKGARRVVKS